MAFKGLDQTFSSLKKFKDFLHQIKKADRAISQDFSTLNFKDVSYSIAIAVDLYRSPGMEIKTTMPA